LPAPAAPAQRADRDTFRFTFHGAVPIPDGGWIAVRVVGPPHRYVADSYAFAHTSPVYLMREGRPPFVSAADATYLGEVVDAIRARVDRGAWRSAADHAAFLAGLDQARAVYTKLAAR
jgi:hypothetical protein